MNKKKILIYAHYYAPDTASTGQLIQDLAEGMLEQFDVTVVCVVPSYTGTIEDKYKTEKYYFEELNGVRIIRVRVPEFTKSKKVTRIKNIIAYFFGALGTSRISGEQDYIFTISQPPILGGILGVIDKWRKHAKMIYCIQDFNPEQIIAVGYSKNKLLLNLMMALDKFSCEHSDLVITVGRDLVATLKERFNGKNVPKYTMINNWIDEKAIYPLPYDNEKVVDFKKKYGVEDKFIIMYSGNIGLYYDLENLIEVIAKFKPGTKTVDGREVVFAFVGDGCMLETLKKYVDSHNMINVVFIPYQEKAELIYSLNAGDAHWCVNSKGIKGVSCPSKAYGIMAVGKPIIGVLEEGSEIKCLIDNIGCGKCCKPKEYKEIEENVRWFIENAGTDVIKQIGMNGRIYLEKELTKAFCVDRYIEAIRQID